MGRMLMLSLLAAALAACGQAESGPTKDEVRKAVQEFIVAKKNITLDALRLEVGSVHAKGDEVTAEVIFAQTEPPKLSMTYTYTLKRAGKSWVVAASAPVMRPTQGHGFGPSSDTGSAGAPAPAAPAKP